MMLALATTHFKYLSLAVEYIIHFVLQIEHLYYSLVVVQSCFGYLFLTGVAKFIWVIVTQYHAVRD